MQLLRPDWAAPANVHAAMTTRGGGASTGSWASLNMGRGSGDESARVDENRRRAFAAMGVPGEPYWLKQVHGARVVRAQAAGGQEPMPEADASWTPDADVVCVVQAADCLPVLFCDDAGTVVAAAHAGWRGLAAGVLAATVQALPVKPARLLAWLGAAIGPQSFEVGPEVRAAFVARDPAADTHFRARDSGDGRAPEPKYLADLYGLARQQLAASGVTRVTGGGRDTFAEPDAFFSYRRDGRCGRMAALVWRSR